MNKSELIWKSLSGENTSQCHYQTQDEALCHQIRKIRKEEENIVTGKVSLAILTSLNSITRLEVGALLSSSSDDVSHAFILFFATMIKYDSVESLKVILF